ncbi:FtsX-like permease family protein [uncultured Arcticibacterium sp.]|mgnify:CR=1 FL=1|uniref:ABC transporter permease n=1 Tax=uncultured Arcticibacterium sp. TaxID=2173042 RepID=UPI0030F62EB9
MLLKLVWNKIWHKRLSSFLCILLMGIGVAIISLVANLSKQLEGNFSKSISGIDMVVGAKGSPLQLILSSVFHIDAPTGNIPLSEVNNLKRNRLVKTLIPLSFGDNYRGYRIVGSELSLLKHYQAELNEGILFKDDLEVVLGSYTAKVLDLKIGDSFESSHGLDSEGETHEEKAYTVVGVLKPTNTVLDKLILSNLESIWHIHEHEGETHEHEDHEVTAALVKFRSPMGLMTIPRMVNENTSMQAALPSIEVNRLFQLFGTGIEIMKYLAYLIVIISGISVFISLFNSLKDQKNEKALMLTLGASRTKVFTQLLLEGLLLSFIGYFLGILLSKLALFSISKLLSETNFTEINIWQFGAVEIYLLAMALLIGIVSAALPALGIYKVNISETLSRE